MNLKSVLILSITLTLFGGSVFLLFSGPDYKTGEEIAAELITEAKAKTRYSGEASRLSPGGSFCAYPDGIGLVRPSAASMFPGKAVVFQDVYATSDGYWYLIFDREEGITIHGIPSTIIKWEDDRSIPYSEAVKCADLIEIDINASPPRVVRFIEHEARN